MTGFLTNILMAWGILSAIACVMFFLIWHAALNDGSDDEWHQ